MTLQTSHLNTSLLSSLTPRLIVNQQCFSVASYKSLSNKQTFGEMQPTLVGRDEWISLCKVIGCLVILYWKYRDNYGIDAAAIHDVKEEGEEAGELMKWRSIMWQVTERLIDSVTEES